MTAPALLMASYEMAGWEARAARFAGFGVVGVGAVGCVLAGVAGDRRRRPAVTVGSMALSGSCALIAGLLFKQPGALSRLGLLSRR